MPNWKAPRLNGCDVWAAIEGTSYHRHFTVFPVFPPQSPFFSPFYQPTSPLSQASVSVTAPSSLQHSNGTWIKSYGALVPNPSSHNLPRQERLLWFCWGVGWLTGVRVGWKVWGDGYIMKYKGETGAFDCTKGVANKTPVQVRANIWNPPKSAGIQTTIILPTCNLRKPKS